MWKLGRSWVATAAVAVTVTALAGGAPPALAGDFDEGQIAKLQEQIDELLADGGSARSGKLRDRVLSCNDAEPLQPFLAWGDSAEYVPVPGASFDDVTGWSLKGGARVVNHASPLDPSGAGTSLFIPDKGEVYTPAMCVGADYPTLRFFGLNTGGSRVRLDVWVIYEDLGGHVKKLRLARLVADETWVPSTPVFIQANRLAVASADGLTAVAFRFKLKRLGDKDAADPEQGFLAQSPARVALGAGEEPETGWYLDGLFVDPFRAR